MKSDPKKLESNGQRGMVALEFGILLPIFMLLTFAIVEFGSAILTHQVISASAREAARYGMRVGERPSAAQVAQKAETYLDHAGLDPDRATVAVEGAQGQSGGRITVEVTYPSNFGFLSTYLSTLPGTIELQAVVVMELS